MRKTFIILMFMFLSLSLGMKLNVLNAQGTVEIGIGSDATCDYLPVRTSYSYSVTQQIYTADELARLNGNYITSVSFYSRGQVVTRKLDVYLLNTNNDYFENNFMVKIETSPVFSGDVQIADNGWTTIAFDKPFLYNTGGNIILCVYDHTKSSPSAPYPVFKVYDSVEEGKSRALYCFTDDVNGFSLSGINGIPSSSASYNNQVKFTYSPSDKYVFTYQESAVFDNVRLGNYWTEREPVSNNVDVKVKAVGTTIENISCNNNFFALSYNLNTNPFTLNVSYNQEQSEADEYTGTITIEAVGVEDVQIPVSVKFYEPVQGDVWEKAICVSSNENIFEHKSSTGSIYDDYILPGEENEDGKANDAVYEFTLARECNVAANVIGTNGNVAVYKAEKIDPENLQEEKHGPSYDNNFYVGPPKTFLFDFDNGDLNDDFTLIDADGDGYGWEIWKNIWQYDKKNKLVSSSYFGGIKLSPDNYVYTNDTYLITETSQLKYLVNGVYGEVDRYSVVILEDGKEFINVFEEGYEHGSTQKERTIDLSPYAGKVVHIGFRHYNCYGQYHIDIDNFELTYDDTSESSNRVADINGKCPAGTYYLVAAAEGDFTLNLSIEAVASVFKGTVDSSWEKGANWSKGSVPGEGDDIVIDAQAELSSEANINYLNIRAGGLKLNAGAALTVDGTITDYNKENGSIVINDGAQVFQKNEGVKASFNMNIINPNNWSEHKDGWQLISSPLLNAETSAFATIGDNNDYDLYKYNGLYELEWRNYKETDEFDEVFESGCAYLASYQEADTANFAGTLNYKTSFSQDFSYSNLDPNIYMANFHLIGNPFTFDMDMDQAKYTNLVSGYAALNSTGSAFSYFTSGTIPVGDGFFVKAKADEASFSYDMNAKRSRGDEVNSINVIATGKAGSDNVIICLAGKKEGFDKLQNFNSEIATIYVSEDNKNYGIYNCESDIKEIGLNFKAEQMGNYTISVKPEGEFQSITLIDRFTGVETDMLLEDYNFIATSGSNHERFILKLYGEQQTTDDDQFVYQSGEELVIDAEGTIQIIDMMGRIVYSNEHSNGDDRISVSEFDNAAYIVRVVNEEGVKVQKVVVY